MQIKKLFNSCLSNLNAEQIQESFQEISNKIDEDKNQTKGRKVYLYNNDKDTKGYAYESKTKQDRHIGFNTRTNDLTKPKEVINTLFHETSNKTKHHSSERNNQDAYARGSNAQSAYHFLKQ